MSKRKMTGSKKKPWMAGIALLAILLFASCTEDETPDGNNDDRPATLALSTVKATDIDVKQVATRAVATTDYPITDSIGFFVKADAANGYVACDNRKGKYSTARQLWLPVDSIWLNKHDADIAIYAPYDATHTTPATLNLTAALRPADGSKDIWCKHITANNANKSPAVTLEHVYSRLYLTVKRDATYKADASLTALDVKGDEVYESATYKPFETAPYTYGTTKGLTPTVTAQTLNASTASTTYDLLLIPTLLTGDITLTLTVDGKKMETIIDKALFTGSKLDAGKQYNVGLALKPGKLDITSVSVVKWDALPEINGGQAEFEEIIDGIDIGLSFVIAPGNLRAVKPAGSSMYEYSFAEEQGYYSGVNGAAYDPSDGDYFCWNELDPSQFDVTHSSWEDARDPCRQIGDGQWHTPTQAQLQKLADLYDSSKAVWGTYTMKDGTTKNGLYFGIATVPATKADQDKYVFLPVAGYRYSTYWYDVGGNGYYWSSTPSASDANIAYGLYFNSSGVVDGMSNDRRYDGFSLRCVKDKPKPAHAIEVESLDFYVADGNVRAVKQADNTYEYSFAEEQGYYSGDGSGGDYFAWNTLDPSMTDAEQSSWDDTRDPCRRIGDGQWSTPTDAQLQKLADLYDSSKAVWGTYTMKDGTTKNGWYFGTATIPATKEDQDKYVFLPAAGYRSNGSGGIANEGSEGSYWSSTPNSSSAYNFYFIDAGCVVDSGRRNYSFSVRCVRAK